MHQKNKDSLWWLSLHVIFALIDRSLRNEKEAMEVYNALTFTGKDNCHNCQNFNKYVNFPTLAIMRSLLVILLSELHYLSFAAQHTINCSQWVTFINAIKKKYLTFKAWIWGGLSMRNARWSKVKPQKLQSFSSPLLVMGIHPVPIPDQQELLT